MYPAPASGQPSAQFCANPLAGFTGPELKRQISGTGTLTEPFALANGWREKLFSRLSRLFSHKDCDSAVPEVRWYADPPAN